MPSGLARDELRCWVQGFFGRAWPVSHLGRRRVPFISAHSHGRREARMIWYLDMERRVGALSKQDRQLLLLSALGHTQRCIGRQIGYSLRSVVRLYAEALETFAAGLPKRYAHIRPCAVDWFDEPQCACATTFTGRPKKKRDGVVR